MSYIEPTTTIFVEALRQTFDAEHPTYPNMPIKVEYPLEAVDYPCLWVQFIPQGDVRNVGIGHRETREGESGGIERLTRWNFSGVVEVVVAALSSLERAKMMDSLTTTIAAGLLDSDMPYSDFRRYVENNDLIGLRVIWESFVVGGTAETPGTPWGSDDVIYEMTLSLTVEGEFVLSPYAAVLAPLSAILVEDELSNAPLAPPPSSDGWR